VIVQSLVRQAKVGHWQASTLNLQNSEFSSNADTVMGTLLDPQSSLRLLESDLFAFDPHRDLVLLPAVEKPPPVFSLSTVVENDEKYLSAMTEMVWRSLSYIHHSRYQENGKRHIKSLFHTALFLEDGICKPHTKENLA
jgi:hypothetical protein